MQEAGTGRAVYIIDDDREIRRSLSFQLKTLSISTRAFAAAEDFLASLSELSPGCILLDVRMPGIDGIDMLALLEERQLDWPVIIMTGHADVPIAVKAMKAGAIELLEKPFEESLLLSVLDRGFQKLADRATELEHRHLIKSRLDVLSPREREVLRHLATGEPNKIIAHALGLSVRTVEMHRANLFTKLGVRSVAEAVGYAIALG